MTYEDLHKSQLQPYTYITWLKYPEVLKNIKDQSLLKVLNRTTMVQKKFFNNLNVLKNWKNVSCIVLPYDSKLTISRHGNLDGSPTMKVAQPPIYSQTSGFYWFALGSPYAMKFLEVMRRIRETNLLHLLALVLKNRRVVVLEETSKMVIDDSINSTHLLMIMSFG